MSKLIEFLKNIKAEGILKELEKDPTTLSITGVEFVSQPPRSVVGYSKIPENALKGLLDVLKDNTTIKYLRADNFLWNSWSIKLFAEFFKNPECCITSISFIDAFNSVDKIDSLLDALKSNITIESIKLGHNYFGDKGLSELINKLSQKPIEALELQNTNIRLENGAIHNFIKFLKGSKVKFLDISVNPILIKDLIELLKNIEETNISELDISGIFFDNDNILGLSSFIKSCKLAGLYFSLSKEVNDESQQELFKAIEGNKSLIECNIWARDIGMRPQNREKLNKEKIIEENKGILKDVAEALRSFYESPILSCDILDYYLKLYQKLNKNCLKEELGKLEISYDAEKIFENVDKYIENNDLKIISFIGDISEVNQ